MSQWHSADELLAAGLTSDSLIDESLAEGVFPKQAGEADSLSGPAEDAPGRLAFSTEQQHDAAGSTVDDDFATDSQLVAEDDDVSRAARSSARNKTGSRDAADIGLNPEVSENPRRAGEADPVELAREIVLRRLSIRAHSRAELVSILRKKNVPEEAAEKVLLRMEELRLINDEQFAEERVRSMQLFKGLGKRMMAQSLRDKGIDENLIEHALAEVDAETEYANALVQAEKKLRTLTGESREVAYRRTAGFLARRGYSPSTVNNVLGELLADWGSEEDE